MSNLRNQVEALLFASGKFMSEENLSLIIGADPKDIRKAIKKLQDEYGERDHSLMIVEENKSWKINVREAYLNLVRKIVADTELQKSVLETLAVIAWKSPVLQSEVVKIRGNKSYEHVAQLEEMGFLAREKEGRSFSLKVTEKFFDYFDVEGDKNMKALLKEVKRPKRESQSQLDERMSEEEQELEKAVEPLIEESLQQEAEEEERDALETTAEDDWEDTTRGSSS